MSNGAALIAAERDRQVQDEGYSREGDRHQEDLLARAGVEYANVAVAVLRSGPDAAKFDPPLRWNWPWSNEFWKPTGDPVRDLTKAGALIAAAIDACLQSPPPPAKLLTEVVAGDRVTIEHREHGIIMGVLQAAAVEGEFYLPIGLGYVTVSPAMFNAGWSLIAVGGAR